MNWLTNVVRPKIKSLLTKKEVPDNLWIKCPETGEMVFHRDLEANQYVVPASGYHMRMPAKGRLDTLFDRGEWTPIALPTVTPDPLKFRDERRYLDRIKDARAKTGKDDAVQVGYGTLDGLPVTAAVQDFDFMGGSLGMAAGEAIVTGLTTARDRGTPFVLFVASALYFVAIEGGQWLRAGLSLLPATDAAAASNWGLALGACLFATWAFGRLRDGHAVH